MNLIRRFTRASQRGFASLRAVCTLGAAGALALLVSHPVLASTPGAAIAGELAGGNTQMMLIIGAVAVLLGILILWAYVKRTR